MGNLSIKDTLRLGPLGVSTIVTISWNSTVSHLYTPLAYEVFLLNSDLCMLDPLTHIGLLVCRVFGYILVHYIFSSQDMGTGTHMTCKMSKG